MNTLSRWNPYREMMVWRNAMDRLFDEAWNEPFSARQQDLAWGMALDVAENQDGFIVKASLPGMNPDDLEITYEKNVLTIKGEIKEDQEVEESRYHLRERRYGAFTRSITLPVTVKADEIEATYQAGVLTLVLPKAEEVRPKRIAVQSVAAPQMISGTATDITSKN